MCYNVLPFCTNNCLLRLFFLQQTKQVFQILFNDKKLCGAQLANLHHNENCERLLQRKVDGLFYSLFTVICCETRYVCVKSQYIQYSEYILPYIFIFLYQLTVEVFAVNLPRMTQGIKKQDIFSLLLLVLQLQILF